MAGGEAIECLAEVADNGDIERRQQHTGGKPNWVANNGNVDLFGLVEGDRTEIGQGDSFLSWHEVHAELSRARVCQGKPSAVFEV
jgi:hypothetical protein